MQATKVTAFHCNFVYCVFVVKIIYTCINLHLESSYTEWKARRCTSATTSAQCRAAEKKKMKIDKNCVLGMGKKRMQTTTTTTTTITREKREGRNEPTNTDDEINGPVILKHLLATARLPWIRVCFAKRNTRKKIIKNWKEKKKRWIEDIAKIAGKTNLQMANSHGQMEALVSQLPASHWANGRALVSLCIHFFLLLLWSSFLCVVKPKDFLQRHWKQQRKTYARCAVHI